MLTGIHHIHAVYLTALLTIIFSLSILTWKLKVVSKKQILTYIENWNKLRLSVGEGNLICPIYNYGRRYQCFLL